MKCPACGGRDLITTTDQVSFYKTHLKTGADGDIVDVCDGKRIDDGDWWVDPTAETHCKGCGHDAEASSFAEPCDAGLVVEALDYQLIEGRRHAHAEGRLPEAELMASLLELRGKAALPALPPVACADA